MLTETSHGENPGAALKANARCVGSQGCARSCVGGDCSFPEHQHDVTSHEFLSPFAGWL